MEPTCSLCGQPIKTMEDTSEYMGHMFHKNKADCLAAINHRIVGVENLLRGLLNQRQMFSESLSREDFLHEEEK